MAVKSQKKRMDGGTVSEKKAQIADVPQNEFIKLTQTHTKRTVFAYCEI
jgi:hypothetical protein